MSNAVLAIEAEEVNLELVINDQLVKHNVTEAVINGLKEKFGALKLKDVEDKEGYLEIKEARKEVRNWGVLTEKICKKGREQAIKEQKLWISKEKEILGKIGEVQDPLDAEIKKFEDEVARKEKEEAERKEAVYVGRQTQLIRMGANLIGGSFVLNEVSFECSLIKDADEDIYTNTILPKYTKVYEAVEAEKVRQEQQRQQEAERLRLQREEFNRQQEAFKQQQAELERQQRELQQKQDEATRQERLRQEELQAAENRRVQQLMGGRINQLHALGLTGNGVDRYTYGTRACVFIDDIKGMNEDKWTAVIKEITPAIQQEKDNEVLRLKEEQKQREESTRKDQLATSRQTMLANIEVYKYDGHDLREMPEDDWRGYYRIKKQDYDVRKHREWQEAENLRKQKEEQQKQEQLALATDKEKYADIVAYLLKTPIHEMKSNIYKGKMKFIKDFLFDIQQNDK